MEIVAVVVAVTHESVTAGAASAVKNGAHAVQFPLEYRNPFAFRVVFLVNLVYTAVAEIGVKRDAGIVGGGSTAVNPVHHVNGHAAVVHQFCHFVDLGRRTAAVY